MPSARLNFSTGAIKKKTLKQSIIAPPLFIWRFCVSLLSHVFEKRRGGPGDGLISSWVYTEIWVPAFIHGSEIDYFQTANSHKNVPVGQNLQEEKTFSLPSVVSSGTSCLSLVQNLPGFAFDGVIKRNDQNLKVGS